MRSWRFRKVLCRRQQSTRPHDILKLVESQAKMVELLAKRGVDKVSQFTVVELTKAQNECMRLGYDCSNSNVPYFTQITLAV